MCVNLSNNLHICVYIGSAFKKICNQFFVKLKIYSVFLKNNFWDLSTATFSPKSMVFNHILLYIKKRSKKKKKKYFLKRKRFPIFCKIQQRFVMSNNVKWSENACLFYIIFLCNKYSDGSYTRNLSFRIAMLKWALWYFAKCVL